MYVVNVLGRAYRVDFDAKLKKSLFGDCDTSHALIRINRKLDARTARETLLHEVIHAILAESGLNQIINQTDGLEEAIVRAMERGLITAGILPNVDPGDPVD